MLVRCFVIIQYVLLVEAFNVDSERPLVVHTSPALGSDVDDLFAYKIILYKTESMSRIVVSAPSGTAPQTVLQRTGLIYTCPITSGECTGLVGNTSNPNDARLFDIQDNAGGENATEDKTGQFLGVDMQTTGSRFICCAHRHIEISVGQTYTTYGNCLLSENNLQNFVLSSPCEATRTSSIFGYGYCQAGTSIDVTGNSTIFGAPGSLSARGSVFVHSTSTVNGITDNQSYLGYTVSLGTITSTTQNDIIASAIKDMDLFGSVRIFSLSNFPDASQPNLVGDQTGSGFGFSLATVDLNGDGYDELLVGAPFHSITSPEVGRVYLYPNNMGSFESSRIIDGDTPYGQFGYAIRSLGDINGDGFEDVAISQPFGDGSGKVFIYNGRNSTELIVRSQVIIGSELQQNNLVGFGTSLSNAVDIDDDGFIDFAVGSFMSQFVVLLRTLPVVKISVNLTESDCSHCTSADIYTRFVTVGMCLSYSGEDALPQLAVQVVTIGDKLFVSIKNQSRIIFQATNSSNLTTEVILIRNADPVCFFNTAVLMNIIDGQSIPTVEASILPINNSVALDIAGNNTIQLSLLPEFLSTTQNSRVVVETDKPYSSTIQIRPQQINVTLVENELASFQVRVRPSQPSALDLYMLIDISFSMNDDLENLQTLASSIVQTLITNSSTENQVGLGFFVDKPLVPYISADPLRAADPCNADIPCEPTFNYRHSLSLTPNGTAFQLALDHQTISGNQDGPESTFDAALQAAVCSEILGWRDDARRLLLIVTDAPPHISGDGKLGGLVVPHDGGCYLSRTTTNVWEYNRSTELDYPSIGQLAAVMEASGVLPVFATESSARAVYERVLQQLSNGFVGTLAADSSNIIQIISDVVNGEHLLSVKLTSDEVPGVDINITPLCSNVNSYGNTCEDVSSNEEVVFNVTMRAEFCSAAINGTTLWLTVPYVGRVNVTLNCLELTPVVPSVTVTPSPSTPAVTSVTSTPIPTPTTPAIPCEILQLNVEQQFIVNNGEFYICSPDKLVELQKYRCTPHCNSIYCCRARTVIQYPLPFTCKAISPTAKDQQYLEFLNVDREFDCYYEPLSR